MMWKQFVASGKTKTLTSQGNRSRIWKYSCSPSRQKPNQRQKVRMLAGSLTVRGGMGTGGRD